MGSFVETEVLISVVFAYLEVFSDKKGIKSDLL